MTNTKINGIEPFMRRIVSYGRQRISPKPSCCDENARLRALGNGLILSAVAYTNIASHWKWIGESVDQESIILCAWYICFRVD